MPLRTALFVPNLIGYVRVLLTLVGYGNALTDWRVTFGCYFVSQGLDAADGFAARLLGQHSSFGAVLDMVTDRASTTCLCIVLGHLYPQRLLTFCCLVTLDLFSHWCAATLGIYVTIRYNMSEPFFLPVGTICMRV